MSDQTTKPTPMNRVGALMAATRNVAQVLMTGGDYRESADYVDRQDRTGQPYPVTVVLMSNHVSAFLRAMADMEEMLARTAEPERDVARAVGQRPVYGPRRREVE